MKKVMVGVTATVIEVVAAATVATATEDELVHTKADPLLWKLPIREERRLH